ncbi:MAG: cytochrome oxidase [Acidobacteriota bacterium]
MDILIITLFVSLLLVVAGLVLFVLRLSAGDFEHGDRLSLLPLEQDETQESQKNP